MTKKIISASRRTDIPAFYTPWLINRIHEGYCVYPNPMYPNKFYRVSLSKQDVLGFVFWTRHPAPLIPHLSELDKLGFVYYFQYTVIGYPRTIDAKSPTLDTAIKTFRQLSDLIGAHRVIWRYDPIVLNKEMTMDWHIDNFRNIADALTGYTQRLVVSVIDPYEKTKRRVGTQENGVLYQPEDYMTIFLHIASECMGRNISVQTCAETEIQINGITKGSCVDANLLYSLSKIQNPTRPRFHNQRKGCLCHLSVDIGVNNTCGFGCKYCYATTNHARALENIKNHQPEWTCITQDVQFDLNENNPQPSLFK